MNSIEAILMPILGLLYPYLFAIPLAIMVIPLLLAAVYVICVIVVIVHYKSIGKL